MNNVAASLLGQAAPANTTAVALVTANQLSLEITALFIANTTGTAATYRLFHDVGGSTYVAANALFYDVSIPANTTVKIEAPTEGAGITLAPGDTLGIRSGTSDALTFSAYGIAQTIAMPR